MLTTTTQVVNTVDQSAVPGDVVDEERSGGSPVVAARYRSVEGRAGFKVTQSDFLENIRKHRGPLPKPLLASGVPDLQFDRLPADVDHPGAELHADGVVGVLFDWSVGEKENVTDGFSAGIVLYRTIRLKG